LFNYHPLSQHDGTQWHTSSALQLALYHYIYLMKGKSLHHTLTAFQLL